LQGENAVIYFYFLPLPQVFCKYRSANFIPWPVLCCFFLEFIDFPFLLTASAFAIFSKSRKERWFFPDMRTNVRVYEEKTDDG